MPKPLPAMPDYHIPLIPGKKYHLLSRAVGNEKLFREPANYQFFLGRLQKYITPVADTLAYCLMPNHFHCMISIKEEGLIKDHFEAVKNNILFNAELAPNFIMERISNMLNSYTKSYNTVYKRKGALFIDYCRRVEVENDAQFGATVFYIHKNPVHHGYVEKMDQWKWSSYNSYLSNKPTALRREEVLQWFGGKDGFLEYHQQPIHLKDYDGME